MYDLSHEDLVRWTSTSLNKGNVFSLLKSTKQNSSTNLLLAFFFFFFFYKLVKPLQNCCKEQVTVINDQMVGLLPLKQFMLMTWY